MKRNKKHNKYKDKKDGYLQYWKDELKHMERDIEWWKSFIQTVEKQLYEYQKPPSKYQEKLIVMMKRDRLKRFKEYGRWVKRIK
jgi:hypothetical protein|tara:strand:- start:936 stop:1187 length:252 start_codon:yes stop_codon:yes gene_type:complete